MTFIFTWKHALLMLLSIVMWALIIIPIWLFL